MAFSMERMREASRVPKGWRTAGVMVKAAMVNEMNCLEDLIGEP